MVVSFNLPPSYDSATPDMSEEEPDKDEAPPAYSAADENTPCCRLSLHPLKSYDGLFVRVEPPEGSTDGHRAPVDITLVIDVSSSMSEVAPMPRDSNGQEREWTGLTTLDLCKHAAHAVIQALDGRDRLAIVTFAQRYQTVQPLRPMVEKEKELAWERVEGLNTGGQTCLWGGILEGLKQFRDDDDVGSARAMMVFTDGRPEGSGSSPSDGWLRGMRKLGKLPAAIHTFGFGYTLKAGLLQTIAGLGGGSYCFIPDIGMIGTAIIHATANLQSTFARKAVLSLTAPPDVGLEESWTDINRQPAQLLPDGRMRYTVDLKTIRYGQILHRHLRYGRNPEAIRGVIGTKPDLVVEATLEYHEGNQIHQVSTRVRLGKDMDTDAGACLSASDIAYHESRTQLAAFLSTLFLLDEGMDGYAPVGTSALPKARERLRDILQDLPAGRDEYRGEQRNIALVKDFRMPDDASTKAEVEQALAADAWNKWGKHFLPSLLFAYVHEMRMSFKDPGTQVFGGTLFQSLVDVLSTAFDTLPPPEVIQPSRRSGSRSRSTSRRSSPPRRQNIDMGELNKRQNTCFAGDTRVLLASSPADRATVAIRDLRAGAIVQTLRGPATVQALLKCHSDVPGGRTMCDLPVVADGHGRTRLRVTLWHPISLDQGATWHFPAMLAERGDGVIPHMSGEKDVYTVLLRRDGADDHPDRHSINVDGVWGVTLGHGLTESGEAAQAEDIRNHPFYGNHDAVVAGLDALPKGPDGVVLIDSTGAKRDKKTGMVVGFIADADK
ncbi:hint-domain-containing protein [Nemania sp. NC0429]|nr:hint-domain-containing protein [Nemania sp. NC0429]